MIDVWSIILTENTKDGNVLRSQIDNLEKRPAIKRLMGIFEGMAIRKTNFCYLHCITIFCNIVWQIFLRKLHSLPTSTVLIESQGYRVLIFFTLQCLLPKLSHWLMSYLVIISPNAEIWTLFQCKSTLLCDKQKHCTAAFWGPYPGCCGDCQGLPNPLTTKICCVFRWAPRILTGAVWTISI